MFDYTKIGIVFIVYILLFMFVYNEVKQASMVNLEGNNVVVQEKV